MFELFELANHVSNPNTYKKIRESIVDLKRIVKMDKVNDMFRDLPLSDQKLFHDSKSYKMYF